MTTHLASARRPEPASIRVRRRIEWADTDASGHWYHGTVFRLEEAAEARLFARLGLSDVVGGCLPRLRVSATYHRILRYDDVIDCVLRVERVGRSSFDLHLDVVRDGDLCAEADIRAVLLERPAGEPKGWTPLARQLLLESGPSDADGSG